MWFKPEHKQEDQFLERAIRGERTGLEYLVHTYKDMAYTVAMRILLNREDAEEVVQDSFMKAFTSLHTFRRASKFSTWLFRIVYNTSLSRLKRDRISTIQLGEELDLESESFIVNDLSEWEQLKQEERKRYIDLALLRLSAEDRTIVTLHYIAEKSIAEICEIVGKEKSAVKMQLLRARKQLEHSLGLLLKKEVKDLL